MAENTRRAVWAIVPATIVSLMLAGAALAQTDRDVPPHYPDTPDHPWSPLEPAPPERTGDAVVEPGHPGDDGRPGVPSTPREPSAPDRCADCGEARPSPSERPPRVASSGGGSRPEYLSLSPPSGAAQIREIVAAVGGRIEREHRLGGLGQVSVTASYPDFDTRREAQARIEASVRGAVMAPNHLYGFAQAAGGAASQPRLYAAQLIGAGTAGGCRVQRAVTIGMIDGPVNPDHPALAGVDLLVESVVPGRGPDAGHGTGVAVLMVGRDPDSGLQGFAQGARLHAVTAFRNGFEGEQASVESIILALDRLVAAGVRLINMSIAGPENAVLAQALTAAAGRGVVMIAASGNERRRAVAWPAAAPEVIAVTAVDAARRRYRMANTGSEVELAAPGVDVYTARARGAGYVSGTSFAAPIVTALAAREMAAGLRAPDAVRARLRARAEPLGGGGHSPEFGYGLARAQGC